jgi:hypothetical protein
LWLDAQGQVVKRRGVLPSVYHEYRPSFWYDGRAGTAASLMPATVLWMLGLASVSTAVDDSGLLAPSPGEPLTLATTAKLIRLFVRRFGWRPLLAALAGGLPFAVLCWRHLRRVGGTRMELVAWVLLVYVFGPPGWIAYRSHRRWPAPR